MIVHTSLFSIFSKFEYPTKNPRSTPYHFDMLLNIYMMLKMTRKLQKVLELVQEELIINYNLD